MGGNEATVSVWVNNTLDDAGAVVISELLAAKVSLILLAKLLYQGACIPLLVLEGKLLVLFVYMTDGVPFRSLLLKLIFSSDRLSQLVIIIVVASR